MKLLAATIVSLAVLFSSGFARSDLTAVHREKQALPCVGECVPRAALVASEKKSRFRLRQWNRANRRIIRLSGIVRHSPSVNEALDLAIETYGHPEIRGKCYCESHFDARAQNKSGASGLCQFLPSTFASTPYHGESIFSPYANAMAAGWMHVHGRGGEWVCR